MLVGNSHYYCVLNINNICTEKFTHRQHPPQSCGIKPKSGKRFHRHFPDVLLVNSLLCREEIITDNGALVETARTPYLMRQKYMWIRRVRAAKVTRRTQRTLKQRSSLAWSMNTMKCLTCKHNCVH